MRIKDAEGVAEKYTLIANSVKGYTGTKYVVEKTLGEDSKQFAKFLEATDAGIGHKDYLLYLADVSGYEADRDEDGNASPGSKKEKIIARIDRMKITPDQKDILFLHHYPDDEDKLWNLPWA